MKYLILIHHNQQARDLWASMSSEEQAEGIQAHAELVRDLVESGEMVLSEALADPSQAKRVLVEHGRATVSDGPFAELKEHLAGFYLVECETIDRALEYAARIPEAIFGTVEVRPVMSQSGLEM
jgi:hypothetical protein